MPLGSNAIQFRMARRRVVEPDGGITWVEELQWRTKEVTASLLGIIPLSSSWSAWESMPMEGFVYTDETYNVITP